LTVSSDASSGHLQEARRTKESQKSPGLVSVGGGVERREGRYVVQRVDSPVDRDFKLLRSGIHVEKTGSERRVVLEVEKREENWTKGKSFGSWP